MLSEFIQANRERILVSTRRRVASRNTPKPTELEMEYGIPLFLDQLSARLQVGGLDAVEIGASATLHGAELLRSGITVGQVVHDYGDVCQAITQLAQELDATISTDEFRTLNLCLDIAIADAVTEYSRQREDSLVGSEVEKLGFLAHELRNLVNTASLAYDSVRSGTVGLGGSTGAVLGRAIASMRALVNRSLADARLDAGIPRDDEISVSEILEDIEIGATMEGKERGVAVAVVPSTPGLAVRGDAQIISSILTNLVQNACKFTPVDGHVTLTTRATVDRVALEVADECGGLPVGDPEELFASYTQKGADRSGLGLGLALSRRGARALGGDIRVRDVPGSGCVFTLDLPRARAASLPERP